MRARLATRRAARAQRGAKQAWRARRVRLVHVHTSQLSCGEPGRGPWRGILGGGAELRVHRHREGTYARLASGELLYGVKNSLSRAEHIRILVLRLAQPNSERSWRMARRSSPTRNTTRMARSEGSRSGVAAHQRPPWPRSAVRSRMQLAHVHETGAYNPVSSQEHVRGLAFARDGAPSCPGQPLRSALVPRKTWKIACGARNARRAGIWLPRALIWTISICHEAGAAKDRTQFHSIAG